jgi:hypothetical protein
MMRRHYLIYEAISDNSQLQIRVIYIRRLMLLIAL